MQISAPRVVDIEQIFLVVGRHHGSGKLPMSVIVHDCPALFRFYILVVDRERYLVLCRMKSLLDLGVSHEPTHGVSLDRFMTRHRVLVSVVGRDA